MHPPGFRLDHTLSDWPQCCLEVRCPCSSSMTLLPVHLLAEQRGNWPFRAVLAALRCSKCRGKPSPVYLVAGHHRTAFIGPLPDWALELVPPPRDDLNPQRRASRSPLFDACSEHRLRTQHEGASNLGTCHYAKDHIDVS